MTRDRTQTIILSVILSIIAGLLCLGLTLAYFGGRQIVAAIKTADWPEVPGRIIESEVTKTTSRPRMLADEIKKHSIQLRMSIASARKPIVTAGSRSERKALAANTTQLRS